MFIKTSSLSCNNVFVNMYMQVEYPHTVYRPYSYGVRVQ